MGAHRPERSVDRLVYAFGGGMVVLRWQLGVLLAALLGAVGLLVFSTSAQSQAVDGTVDEDPRGAPYVAGELLVTYKEDTSEKEEESVEQASEREVVEEIPEIDTEVFEFPQIKNERAEEARERDLEQAKEELEKVPAVESVEYNYLRKGFYTPNDPKFGQQWGLRKTGFETAWNKTRGGGVRVAVVDSGVAMEHVDLKYKTVAKWDFVNNNSTVEDLNGHGTHISGIVAARTGNGKGVAGGCPGCRIIMAKGLDRNLFGYDSNLSKAIIWSANKGARVINLSWGSTARSGVITDAIDYAKSKGAVVVAAGGNYGTNEWVYPAAYGPVMAVAWTDRYDRRAGGSSYGAYVDVAAPGVDILSTVPGGYSVRGGSSMSAPHVSALAGLLASQGLSAKAIRGRIQNTAKDLGPTGRDPYYGYGRISASRAVR